MPRKKGVVSKKKKIVRRNPFRHVPIGMPDSMKVRLRYAETVSFTPGITGQSQYFNFVLNGLYDPSLTTVGHQPLFFDQYMLGYDHYTVLGCHYKLLLLNNDSLNTGIITITIQDNDSTLTNAEHYMEAKNTRTYTLGTNSSDNVRTIRGYVDVPRFLGKSKSSIVGSELYRGTVAVNPLENVYMQIGNHPITNLNVSGAVKVQCILTFDAVLTERKIVAQS